MHSTVAFIPVIQSQGTDEQIAKWLSASKRHAILGCYAQTELRYVVQQPVIIIVISLPFLPRINQLFLLSLVTDPMWLVYKLLLPLMKLPMNLLSTALISRYVIAGDIFG